MKGFHPPTQTATSKNYKVTEEYKKMFRKTIPLSLLAAAALMSSFLPAAQANQIEVNKQNAVQNAAAVGTSNYVEQELNQTSLQNQETTAPRSSGYYHIPQPGTPQIQISGQEGVQNGAAVGISNHVDQELNQTSLQNQETTTPRSSGYYHIPQPGTPQIQISGQEGVQNGAAVGIGNYIDQELNQTSLQRQVKF